MTATAAPAPRELAMPARFDEASARDAVTRVAAVMERAGLLPYLAAAYFDSQPGGLEKRASNTQNWRIHDTASGTPETWLPSGGRLKAGQASMGVAVWGGRAGLYRGRESFDLDDGRTTAMAGRIGRALRAAGMKVITMGHCGNDAGWGTRNVNFQVVFAKV